MTKWEEKFVNRVAQNMLQYLDTSKSLIGANGCILTYSPKRYKRIVRFLTQINEKTNYYNVGVSIDAKGLKPNEIRVFFLN